MGLGVFTYFVFLTVTLEIIYTDASCNPSFDEPYSTITVGSKKQYVCKYTSCSTNQSLSWRVNGDIQSSALVSTNYSTDKNVTEYNGISRFGYTPSRPSSSSENTARVTCHAGSNEVGITVNIHYGPDNPVLNKTGTIVITEYNSTSYIICQSNCNPPCNYKFSKDGSTISSYGSNFFYKSSVRRYDDGLYRCIASNTVNNRTSSMYFRLNVQYPPAFSLSRTPSSEQVEEGTLVSFSFTRTDPGNPSTYTFLECDHSVDGTSLRNISYIKSSSEISFTIQNVSITDRGEYTCRVTNNITNRYGGLIVEGSVSLKFKTPPLILMKTKTVRKSGENFSLSVDFISLTYSPEVHWFRIMEGQTGESAINNELNSVSYTIVKDDIDFIIPSYITRLNTSHPGRYISFVKNAMGAEVVEYIAATNGSSDEQSGSATALLVVGSLFLVLGLICLGVAVFLYFNLKKTREKAYKERHASLFILPSANALNPNENEYREGEVNPINVEFTITKDEDSSPGVDAPSPPSSSIVSKYKQHKQTDGGAVYENSEIKSSESKYVTLTSEQHQVPLYETPQTLTDANKLKFNKKDKNTYANEKRKKPKKKDADVKNYANLNFGKGKAKTYENHEPGS